MAKSRLYSLLGVAIRDTLAKQHEYLSSGQLPDYPSYKDMTGYIRGLSDALKLCDEIEEDMNK